MCVLFPMPFHMTKNAFGRKAIYNRKGKDVVKWADQSI